MNNLLGMNYIYCNLKCSNKLLSCHNIITIIFVNYNKKIFLLIQSIGT